MSTNPAGGATNVALNTNLTITFSEPVNVTGIWLSLVGQMSGNHGATVSGGPATYTIDPDRDFASGESVTVTVFSKRVSNQDMTPNTLAADFSFSFTIAAGGSDCGGATATRIHAIPGGAVSVEPTQQHRRCCDRRHKSLGTIKRGTQFRGFYVQEEDADADSNPATSEDFRF